MELAVEFRQRFNADVFVDILAYRKYGHNEGDEPRFTQPTLYKAISKHPNPRDIYGKVLIEQNIYEFKQIQALQDGFNQYLENKLDESKDIEKVIIQRFLEEDWAGFRYSEAKDFILPSETKVTEEKLLNLSKKITALPKDLPFFKKVRRIMDDRKKMVQEDRLDWVSLYL